MILCHYLHHTVHTSLLRPTQSPDGTFLLDVPIPQLLREMQPDAKFIVTVNDPVRRMYSDYYFLHDNLKPLRPGMPHNKSGEEFHYRAEAQVRQFKACVQRYVSRLAGTPPSLHATNSVPDKDSDLFPLWFRASQMYVATA
jgi:hypothetical protein